MRTRILGLTLGAILGWCVSPLLVAQLHAQQTKNITSGDGFSICYDVTAPVGAPPLTLATAQALATDIRFDGAAIGAGLKPTWLATTTAGVFEVQFPESQFPAGARATGNHTYSLTIGGVAITLADGSVIQPGTTITDTYTIVCKNCGPNVGNGRWKKIIGGLMDALRGLGRLVPG